MEVLNDITRIVDWYKSLPVDYIDIDTLMMKRTKLTHCNFGLSVQAGKARKDWKVSQSLYSSERARLSKKYESNGTTKAEWSAKANTSLERENMDEAEGIYYSIDYILKAVKEVLTDMNQRIAYLRAEKEGAKHG